MNSKTKELLIDLAHLVHQAIITDDDAVSRQALGDVADALASILPLDGSEKMIAREADATVERQMDDDDLAQRLENA